MRDPGNRPPSTRNAGGARPYWPWDRRTAGPEQPSQAADAAGDVALTPAGRRALVADKLFGLAGLQLDWSEVRDCTLATLQEALIDRQVPSANLTAPKLEVVVPALEAMRYSGLRREFALLIASTMNADTASDAHPAFVEILKQLTPDEVNILSALPAPGQVVAMANLYHLDRAGHVRASMRRVIPDALAARCARQEAIPAYIDNMIRLSLIETPTRLRIDDERFYRELLAQERVRSHSARMPAGLRPRIERSVLVLTDFGSQFRRCCIDAAEPAPRALRR